MKKIFSLLAALLLTATAFATFVIVKGNGTLSRTYGDKLIIESNGSSFTINGVDVAEISTIQNKVWNSYGEYERGFLHGYVNSQYYTFERSKQVNSLAFKEMLKTIVEKYAPDSLTYFNSRISDNDVLISRGTAAMMAYYVARCINATEYNSGLHRSQREDIWEGAWGTDTEQVLPYAHAIMPESQEGWQESVCAILWDAEHVTPYSNKEVVEFLSDKDGFAWAKAFTWEEAVLAVTRLCDEIEYTGQKPKVEYADITDSRVTSPDPTVITPDLIAFASSNEIKSIDELPRIYGSPVCPMEPKPDNDGSAAYSAPKDIEELARWGFSSVQFRTPYWFFINDDLKANLNLLKALDEMIAVCMEYNIHFNLYLTDIPGRGMKLQKHIQDDYIMDNDILNPVKREKARKIWNTFASRYKNVPNRNLSFTTIHELHSLGENVSAWGEGKSFSYEEIVDFQDYLFDAVREIDSNRFIFYDLIEQYNPTGKLAEFEESSKKFLTQYEHVSKKYSNTRPMVNLMDMAFGFYSYNTGDGNIDYAMHSSWVPQYPATLYDADRVIGKGEKLSFDGVLPKGTKFIVYLASAEGTFTANVDGKDVYEESFLKKQQFKVGYSVNYGHPYAQSDKAISFELSSDAKAVTLSAGNGSFEWCGIDVVLPEAYTIQKWRHDSEWDVELGYIKQEDFHSEFYKKSTSTIEIAPTNPEAGRNITLNNNLTYTTEQVRMESNASVYDHYGSTLTKMMGRWSQRVEGIVYSDYESHLRFFEDLAKMYQKYKIDTWLPFHAQLFEETYAPYMIAGYEGEEFEGHHNFNLKLLRILQKYQDK